MSNVKVKKAAVKTAKPLTAWSMSRLSLYEQCPFKFKAVHIDGLKEPGSKAMDNGKAVHARGEQYLKGQVKVLPADFKLLAVEMEEAKAVGAESELEVTFTKDWRITGWFADDAWLRIKIDILVLKEDAVTIVDLKTGKNRGGYEDQLELYALAALLMYPEADKVSAELWFTDTGEIIGTSHGDYAQKDVPALKKKWEKRVRPMFMDKLFSPRPNVFCGYCHFRKNNDGPCTY